MSPRISIVILSFNRAAMLRQSVLAALAQARPADEIIVVDNESPASDDIAALVAGFPHVRHVRTGANLGFARGMNVGLQQVAGELVLLTEDDMILHPGALGRLEDAHEAAGAPALLSGIMRDRDTGTVWFAGATVALGATFRRELHHRGAAQVEAPATYPTDYIAGAFVFGRTALLRELGGFRDEFFMYWEDDELCLRARAAGVALRIVRDAEAVHFTPSPSPASEFIEFHKLKNRLALYLLHAPLGVLLPALARYGVLEPLLAMRSPARRVQLRALAWVAGALPRLLYDRWRGARLPPLAAVGGESGRTVRNTVAGAR